MIKKPCLEKLVILLVFGMTVVGCNKSATNNDTTNSSPTDITITDSSRGSGDGGTFTLNNIPSEFNGKYAYILAGSENVTLGGGEPFILLTFTITGSRILNGSVRIPMWIITDNGTSERYSGNHTVSVECLIINSADGSTENGIASIEFESVAFSNGNATISCSQGTVNF